jgi:hypothetical protein
MCTQFGGFYAQGDGCRLFTHSETPFVQIATMKRVNHPNCVMLYEVFDEPNKTYLVLDL